MSSSKKKVKEKLKAVKPVPSRPKTPPTPVLERPYEEVEVDDSLKPSKISPKPIIRLGSWKSCVREKSITKFYDSESEEEILTQKVDDDDEATQEVDITRDKISPKSKNAKSKPEPIREPLALPLDLALAHDKEPKKSKHEIHQSHQIHQSHRTAETERTGIQKLHRELKQKKELEVRDKRKDNPRNKKRKFKEEDALPSKVWTPTYSASVTQTNSNRDSISRSDAGRELDPTPRPPQTKKHKDSKKA